jgi:P-type Ca2+ transporter type 2C
MGVVTFALYDLLFSIETRDERRTAFSLDTFSDSKFVIATGLSILTLLLTTVFGPLQAFLKTTSLDGRQWLICLAVALSIVVVSEIQKTVRRHTPHPAIKKRGDQDAIRGAFRSRQAAQGNGPPARP